MIKILDKLVIIVSILIITNSNANEELLFTINNNPSTSIDLNQRVIYLNLLNSFEISEINKNKYINDLVSVKLFDEYALRKRIKIKQSEIQKTFDLILINNKEKLDELITSNQITKEIIIINIRYDLQRKIIIESFLTDRANNISLTENNHNIMNMYNIILHYFIINNQWAMGKAMKRV